MDAKSIFKSKTFWFNMIGAILEVLRGSGILAVIPQEAVAGGLVVGNTLLRFLTNQPVKLV